MYQWGHISKLYRCTSCCLGVYGPLGEPEMKQIPEFFSHARKDSEGSEKQ